MMPTRLFPLVVKLPDDPAVARTTFSTGQQLHQTLFNPDRLQAIFVGEIEKLVRGRLVASLTESSLFQWTG